MRGPDRGSRARSMLSARPKGGAASRYAGTMRVLVTGGAGYIGAHTVRELLSRGDEVTVVDDLSTGVAERVDGARLVILDLRRADLQGDLTALLAERGIEAVIHFAAKKRVDESFARPADYVLANVAATAVVVGAMRDAGTPKLVLSSTAAVYGDIDGRVTESAPTLPISPYGATKLAAETTAGWAAGADGLSAVSLRYFNVAGTSWPDLVERGASNLIPQVVARLDGGERPQIYGNDYPTSDGTCVRDFVHVADVTSAHLAVLDAAGDPGHRIYNVGTGTGRSVAEIVSAVCAFRGVENDPEILPRREGDSAIAIADVSLIEREVGWSASRGLDDIIASSAG
jgi:UDP-glucose 4-epimerase